MKKVLLLLTPIICVIFILYNSISSHSLASNISREDEYYYNEDLNLNEDGSIMNSNKSTLHMTQIDTVKDSLTVLVNKEYALPADYVPSDLVVPDVLFNFNYYDEKKLMRQVAATALEELFEAAKEEGLNLYAISGYRSYDRQKEIYDTNVRTKGIEYTNRYSARPGHSEHQTGLVMDVSTSSIGNLLEPVFAYTPEGKWLAENAQRFGFIIRYPEDKEEITGYSYEPWHIRYVGPLLAKNLYDNNLTLEEYYNYTPSELQSTEISYDNIVDIDNSTEKKEIKEPTQEEIDNAAEVKAQEIKEENEEKALEEEKEKKALEEKKALKEEKKALEEKKKALEEKKRQEEEQAKEEENNTNPEEESNDTDSSTNPNSPGEDAEDPNSDDSDTEIPIDTEDSSENGKEAVDEEESDPNFR